MKSVLNMFKSKDENEAVTKNENYENDYLENQEDEYEFELSDEDDFDDEEYDDYEDDDIDSELDEDFEDDSDDIFEEFTDKVQSLLDEGAYALEIAEQKTAQLENINPEEEDYEGLVAEIKEAQAQARQNFDDAEFLIQRANEILENNAN